MNHILYYSYHAANTLIFTECQVLTVQCHRKTDGATDRQTIKLTASSRCVGMLEGLVMDLQNLQYYLSEELLPLCIMDERDEGIRLFMLNNKELD